MSDSLVIFKVVSESSEQQFLLQKLLASDSVIHLKLGLEESLHLKAQSLNSNMQLKCHRPEGSAFDFPKQVTATFYVGYEKYLFETQPLVQGDVIVLPVAGLFHLQRRKNFRYTIPSAYFSELSFHKFDGKDCRIQAHIIDLSTEGCAADCAASAFKFVEGQKFEGEIRLGHAKPIPVRGFIKNIRPDGQDLVLGIEFHHFKVDSETAIENAITDLQRDLFLRRAA